MKTDSVLTMDEYLAERLVASKHVSPPAASARHVAITAQTDVDPQAATIGRRCDRWGHPCPDCVERNVQPAAELPVSTRAKQTK
jgi:hypothetical protein